MDMSSGPPWFDFMHANVRRVLFLAFEGASNQAIEAASADVVVTVLNAREQAANEEVVYGGVPHLEFAGEAELGAWLRRLSEESQIARCNSAFSISQVPWLPADAAKHSASICMPGRPFPTVTSEVYSGSLEDWVCTNALLQASAKALGKLPRTIGDFLAVESIARINVSWHTSTTCKPVTLPSEYNPAVKAIELSASVMAAVPHRGCEEWLERCLRSLTTQTRPLQAIAVIDDFSPTPPAEIVSAFPSVTLLRSHERCGPYRLVNSLLMRTSHQAVLFQDADDWSSVDRVEHLLTTASKNGADYVGMQEIRVEEASQQFTAVSYPLDVNIAASTRPGHPLLHPTSIVSRGLIDAVSGFSMGLRFGGDSEFLFRAVFAGRVINSSSFGYFRRSRLGSLTSSPETGLESTVRAVLWNDIKARFFDNLRKKRQGLKLDLAPLCPAPMCKLSHVCGPPLF